MIHRPLVPVLAALLVLGLAAGVQAEETKTFASHNVRWTVPDGWTWSQLPGDMASAGYIAQVERQADNTYARVTTRVAPTQDLPLQELTRETRDTLTRQLDETTGSRVTKGILSGIEGTQVIVRGKTGGHDAEFRVFSIEQGGRFHQLIFFLVNGAETRQASQLETVRRGYRLIEGAGPEEPADESGGFSAGGGEDVDLDMPSTWPEAGPQVDGRTLVFPNHNLRWTLPEGSPFAWRAPIEDESAEEGRLVVARAAKPRDVEPGEEGKVPQNICTVALYVRPAEPGFIPSRLVASRGLQSNVAENLFDRAMFERTKEVPELEIGNVKGAALQMLGTKEQDILYFRLYAVGLKGEQVTWEAQMRGDTNVDDLFKDELAELMEGVEFIDTVEPIMGPLAVPGIPPFTQDRGFGEGEEKEITSVGFSIDKPEPFIQIAYQPQEVPPSLRLAWETRTEDQQKYMFVAIQTFTDRQLRDSNMTVEKLVEDRVTQWRANVEGAAVEERRGEPYWNGRYARGRGIEYELRGTLAGQPFVEEGYLVEYKRYVYWVQIQYGGEEAADAFSKLARSVERALKMQS